MLSHLYSNLLKNKYKNHLLFINRQKYLYIDFYFKVTTKHYFILENMMFKEGLNYEKTINFNRNGICSKP